MWWVKEKREEGNLSKYHLTHVEIPSSNAEMMLKHEIALQ